MKDIYSNLKNNKINYIEKQNVINVSYMNGCKVEILGANSQEYNCKLKENNKIIYETKMKNNRWSQINKKYFGNYSAEIFCSATGRLLKSDSLNLENKNVQIIMESSSLGDSLAWIPQFDLFQKKHKCNLYLRCKYEELFEKEYPNLNFKNAPDDCYASYSLGYFVGENWNQYTPVNPKNQPLCKVAADVLGLDYQETRPKISVENKKNNFSKPYVCIATQSTAQCKYWNNKEGWEKVCQYLQSMGLDVICIDKHPNFGNRGVFNTIPASAENKTGDLPLQDRITDIYNCEFFIGLGSGLSWVAWALKKPVVLISGFSSPDCEFFTPYRVHNKNVCNSCWNDEKEIFDRGNWLWCPRNKDFECSKEITFEMVKEKIDMIINKT